MFVRRFMMLVILSALWTHGLCAQEAKELSRQAPTIVVPDFKDKTLEQVQAQAGLPGHANAMFIGINPQGTTGGIVVSQSPVPGTTVVRGTSRLLITLEAPKPSGVANFINQVIAQVGNHSQDETRVPNLGGDNHDEALQLLASAGLGGTFNGDLAGVVTQQSPLPGREAKRGAQVVITLAIPDVTVPLLDGLTLPEAAATLEQRSLRTGATKGGGISGAKVFFQSLPAGSQVPTGTPVDLTLASPESSPPPVASVAVPSLIGMTSPGASSALASLKLIHGHIGGPSTGLVVSQTVRPGTMIAVGGQVGFSLKVRQVVVPNVISESEGDARNKLTAFHLFTRIPNATSSDANTVLTVATESPAAGTLVDPGSVVDLSMSGPGITGTIAAFLKANPLWVWAIAIAALFGVGFTFRRRTFFPPHPAALSTLASSTTPQIKLTDQTGPGIRFAISLRDRSVDPTYSTASEPQTTRKASK